MICSNFNYKEIRFCILLFLYVLACNFAIAYPFRVLDLFATYLIFYLFFLKIKPLFYVLLWIVGIYSIVYLPQGILYGPLSLGIIASLFETNSSESLEYLKDLPLYTYFLSLLLLLLILLISYFAKELTIKKTNKKIPLYLIFILIGIYYKPIKESLPPPHKSISIENTRVYIISLPLKIYHLFQDYSLEKSNLLTDIDKESTWKIQSVNPKYQDYIVVIGESMRMDYLSSYGFPLNTTPFLKNTKGKIYQGYVSAGPNTYPSLKYALYQLNDNKDTIYENNLISLAKMAGFDTYWLSNQGFLGKYDTISSRVAIQSNYYYFSTKGGYDENNNFDHILLPKFKEILEHSTSQPRLIVLHLMGSHPGFCNRLWQHVEFNYINEDLSCYLQSIKQTDGLLEDMIKLLQKNNRSYSLIYFSDHGLSFTGNNSRNITLRVGNHTKQNYEVPLIVLSSDDTKKELINFKQTSANFLYGFAEWIGIEFNDSMQRESFWEGNHQEIQVYDWNSWINFDDLDSKPALPVDTY